MIVVFRVQILKQRFCLNQSFFNSATVILCLVVVLPSGINPFNLKSFSIQSVQLKTTDSIFDLKFTLHIQFSSTYHYIPLMLSIYIDTHTINVVCVASGRVCLCGTLYWGFVHSFRINTTNCVFTWHTVFVVSSVSSNDWALLYPIWNATNPLCYIQHHLLHQLSKYPLVLISWLRLIIL